MKKIICIFVAVVMSFGLSIQTFASNINDNIGIKNFSEKAIISENFGNMLTSVLNSAETFGIDKKSFETFTVMNPVSFNSVNSDDLESSITHFPMPINMERFA